MRKEGEKAGKEERIRQERNGKCRKYERKEEKV